MRILLIAGGWSNEREVSLSGAKNISSALTNLGHDVTFFDLSDGFNNLLESAVKHDFAFINLHGVPGEDGLVQTMLDTVKVPYQGSGAAASFLALHKAATKQIYRMAGIPTPDWEFFTAMPSSDWQLSFDYPVFVKSNTGGSSLLLFCVSNRQELDMAMVKIFAAGCDVILEPSIDGVDTTCGVLGDKALPPILIRPRGEFFDYASKYENGGAVEICPAPLPQEINAKMQELALKAHQSLGLSGYSRTDFRLMDDGTLFTIETNTLPGMTNTSLIPQEAAEIGIDFGPLLEELIRLGLEKN